MLWKEMKFGLKVNFIFLIIPLILILLSSSRVENSNEFKMDFKYGNTYKEYNVTIIPTTVSKVESNVKMYMLIVVFIAFCLPFKFFEYDKNTLEMILCSPIRNNNILYAKYLCIVCILLISTILYALKLQVNIYLMIILFLIGMLCISIGSIAGIFNDNKWVGYMVYLVSLLLMMIPTIFKKEYVIVLKSLNYILQDNKLLLMSTLILVASNFILFLILVVLWNKKLRRMRL